MDLHYTFGGADTVQRYQYRYDVSGNRTSARVTQGTVDRLTPSRVRGPRKFLGATIGKLTRAVAKASVVAGIVANAAADAAVRLPLLDIESNPSFNELTKATRRGRAGAGLNLSDDAFSIIVFCGLTQERLTALAACESWSNGE